MLSSIQNLPWICNRLARAAQPVIGVGLCLLAISGSWAAAQVTNSAVPQGNPSAQSVDRPLAEDSASVPKARVELISDVAWEYSPYQVVVWLVDDGSEVFRRLGERIRHRILRDAQLDEFNGWQVHCARPNVIWNSRLGCNWDIELADLTKPLSEDAALQTTDKLIVLRLGRSSDGYLVQSRELDLATKQWSGLTNFPVAEIDLIPARAYSAMKKSFMPLTRIERVSNETVYVRTRASALSRRLETDVGGNISEVPNSDSPLWVRDSDILLPVLRREARENRSALAEPVAWTLLSIEERLGSTLKCFTHTAQLAPLAGRSGSTIKKFALVVRPDAKPTTLFITAQESKNAAPISGLEVYYCRPEDIQKKDDQKKGAPNNDYRLLGKTDWKGAITIAPTEDGSIRYIIVRNGAVAFKKPLLPGLNPSLTAAVPSDRARVFAEGVLFGLRGEIIELAALRATTKMRIEIALEKKQFEKADKILNKEYLTIVSFRQLAIRMAEIKERLMSRKDADLRQRGRIERMFKELETAIAQNLQSKKKSSDNENDSIGGEKEQESDDDLIRRVMNKDSTPRAAPAAVNPTNGSEGVVPPNKPQPDPTTTPAAESQEFD